MPPPPPHASPTEPLISFLHHSFIHAHLNPSSLYLPSLLYSVLIFQNLSTFSGCSRHYFHIVDCLVNDNFLATRWRTVFHIKLCKCPVGHYFVLNNNTVIAPLICYQCTKHPLASVRDRRGSSVDSSVEPRRTALWMLWHFDFSVFEPQPSSLPYLFFVPEPNQNWGLVLLHD